MRTASLSDIIIRIVKDKGSGQEDQNKSSEMERLNYYIITILANITWSFVVAVLVFKATGVLE